MLKHINSGKTRREQDEIGNKTGKQNRGPNKDVQRRTTITPETAYGECSERLTVFGGLWALLKFPDPIGFEKAFREHYVHPNLTPKLSGYRIKIRMGKS